MKYAHMKLDTAPTREKPVVWHYDIDRLPDVRERVNKYTEYLRSVFAKRISRSGIRVCANVDPTRHIEPVTVFLMYDEDNELAVRDAQYIATHQPEFFPKEEG